MTINAKHCRVVVVGLASATLTPRTGRTIPGKQTDYDATRANSGALVLVREPVAFQDKARAVASRQMPDEIQGKESNVPN